ncbi:MAG: methyltransferase domain-containing protein, partial [Solirubrobacterales bacterium]|nr:methyltransferase domain-containing protein [Solirubrobacterales bacterium]
MPRHHRTRRDGSRDSPAASLTDRQVRERIASVAHWYHRIEIRPGIVTPGISETDRTLKSLDLPARCDGMRVLDIGVRDGYFSFELERRGAEVVAIDYIDAAQTGFAVAHELLGSQVEYVVDNIYNVVPERYGTFDIVLFLGVVYHLRDPLLALDRLWDVCNANATLALETQILDSSLLMLDGSFESLGSIDPRLDDLCLMQFHPGDSLHGDHTNYWSPNAACTRGLMEAAGFEIAAEVILGTRGVWVGRRTVDFEQIYHRRIEKATVAEGPDPAPPAPSPEPTDATVPTAAADVP